MKHGGDIEPSWEAELLLGAVAELTSKYRTLENGVGAGYADYRGLLPDCTVTDLGTDGVYAIARGQKFAGAHDSVAAIAHSVERVSSRFGLSVDSVTIFHALGAAPAVVLTAPDVSAVWSKFGSLEAALFESRPRYEGFYLEIRGQNGKPYIRRSTSYRTGGGDLWTDPSLR